MIDLQEEKS